eukprot:TRINITY_DN13499_c0_g1_i1.p1 TRINITY_DN13499_c0_g1~~TRINITY_DN13499_c0_g1_i1.p1  ORF type:complete len:235 (+),score=51.05 TRINITY_DN13499_c0_g1_i1:62-706(+)
MPNPLHILHRSDQNQLGLAPVHLWPEVLPRLTILVEPEYICVEAGSFPDKTDCSRFYTCNIIGDKLVGFTFNCPPSLLYNSTAELCDWPERVECSKAADDDTAATKSARSGNNPVIIDIEDKFECPGPGSYPVPTSCAFYYSCTMVGGLLQAEEVQCPPDLLFNTATGTCEPSTSFSCSLPNEEDICLGDTLTAEEKLLCNSNAWKHSDQFIRF